jgi:hypothetical protein
MAATRVAAHPAGMWVSLSLVAALGTAIPVQPSETDIFERARRSVVLVETESGHGSGFLVDATGLILTNDHVLGSSPYLAVALDPEHKFAAIVLARDSALDLAVIQVNPRSVEGIRPLSFAGEASVKVGARVLAIGSALTGVGTVLTTGIVSGLSAGKIVADVNVNPGTSGGPLLGLTGEVIGICTTSVKAAAGPGLAGIVPAALASALISRARLSRADPPSVDRLPVASPTPYPAGALRERALALRPDAYGVTIGGTRLDVLTPPGVYRDAHQAEFDRGRSVTGYNWQAGTGHVEALVGIRVVPRIRRVDEQRLRLVDNVRRLRLLRNGIEVVPIVPGRFCDRAIAPRAAQNFEGCLAFYQYAPEAFAPGATLEIQVYSDGTRQKPERWKLPAALIALVWADFGPWRSALPCPVPCLGR